jgi:hypothetical protein
MRFAGRVGALLLAVAPLSSFGLSITVGPVDGRQATLSEASAGSYDTGNGTVVASDIDAAFPALAPWSLAGNVAGAEGSGAGGSDGGLTVALTSGTWGSKSVSGTWAISPAFWAANSQAVISMHVGQGGQDKLDDFLWLIVPGQLSGTWSYSATGGGGGLSNLRLFGSETETSTSVPDAGSSAMLLGISLGALGLIRRRWSR